VKGDETLDPAVCTESIGPPGLVELRLCPATEACVVYAWRATGDLPECRTECGVREAAHMQNYTCIRANRSLETDTVALDECEPTQPPVQVQITRECPATSSCDGCGGASNCWAADDFPPCPEACGQPVATAVRRSVGCIDGFTAEPTDPAACAALELRPVGQKDCAENVPCVVPEPPPELDDLDRPLAPGKPPPPPPPEYIPPPPPTPLAGNGGADDSSAQSSSESSGVAWMQMAVVLLICTRDGG
jgi:hypothetical protein